MNSAFDLATQLRDARKAAGLTLAQMSARTGIPTRSLLRMEAGDSSAPIGRIMLVFATLGYELNIKPTSRPTLDALQSIYVDDNNAP